MNKIYIILTVIVLVFMTGITTNFYAQQGYGYGRDQIRQEERDREILGIPGLTREQKEQIKNLHAAYLKDIQPLKNELEINMENLDTLLTEDQPDLNEINKLIDENGSIMTELRKKQVAQNLEIRNLLTDKQKVFFDNTTLRDDFRLYRDDIRPYRYNNRPYRYNNRPYNRYNNRPYNRYNNRPYNRYNNRPYRYNNRPYRDDNRPYRYLNRPYRDGRIAHRYHPYRHLR